MAPDDSRSCVMEDVRELLFPSTSGRHSEAAWNPLPAGKCMSSRYRILRELNRGATAIVYEAEDYGENRSSASCPRKVALKVLLSNNGRCATPTHAVQREICCADSLEHPNIARLLDVVARGEELAMAWELVRGPDLLEYVQRCNRRMPEALAAHYFRQLVEAVAYMHSKGISHRDLKPENCMVDLMTHALKVIDFGLAARTDAPMSLGVGTVDYLAPELIKSCGRKPSACPISVDTWGLGVTLYIMLAGRLPFQDPMYPHCLRHTLTNIKHGRMRPLPDHVSRPAAELVRALLRTTATLRPGLAAVASHPWLSAAAGAPGLPSAALREAFLLEGDVFAAEMLHYGTQSSSNSNSCASEDTTAECSSEHSWAEVSMAASNESSCTQNSYGNYSSDQPSCTTSKAAVEGSRQSFSREAPGVPCPISQHSGDTGGGERYGGFWGAVGVSRAEEGRPGESTWEETVRSELGSIGTSLRLSLDSGHSGICAGAELVRQGSAKAKTYLQRFLGKAPEGSGVVHVSADARTDLGPELSGVVVQGCVQGSDVWGRMSASPFEPQGSSACLRAPAQSGDGVALPPLPSPLLSTTSDVSSQVEQAGRQRRVSFGANEGGRAPLGAKSTLLRAWSGGELYDSARELHTLDGQPGQIVPAAPLATQSRPCFLRQLAEAARRCT